MERESSGLLGKILPPRLEDAGIEDCALPPELIKEAFFKAATAVKSRAASIFATDSEENTEGDCINDPWPENGVQGSCATEKGGGKVPAMGGDEVVAPAWSGAKDEVVGGEVKEGEEACVDGLQGLEVEKEMKNGGDDKEGDEAERPILVEGFV